MNKIPTAEEFLVSKTGVGIKGWVTEVMIEFAKLHLEAQKTAIKTAIEKPLEDNFDIYLTDDWAEEITGNSLIDDAYSPENIK
jgi:hypothetical protein